ncbi:MAG: hypothetical protein JHC33_12415 [Ignisphaera sp.]|nr:hypothetical protein [Ignisphaera sp.]
MPWLLIIEVVLLVAMYLFMPTPSKVGSTEQSPSGLKDFETPDNSSSRVVPVIYGTVYLKGNCIYYSNLTNKPIYVFSGG